MSALSLDERWFRDRLSRALVIDRPDEAALKARCEGVTDPEEAWDFCAPVPWSSRAWRFVGADGAEARVPSTVPRVCAFCAAPSAIEAADELSRELAARLAPHGAAVANALRWRFWMRDLWVMGALAPTSWRGPSSPITRALAAIDAKVTVDARVARAIEQGARDAVLFELAMACARWDATRAEGNPFEVMIELYACGVSLVSIEPLELAIAD